MPRLFTLHSFVCIAIFVSLAGMCRAENWPGWRGPTGMGVSTEKDFPHSWNGKTGENVLWKVPLGGVGNSSPIVWGDRVFVTISKKQKGEEEKAKLVPEHWVACFQTSDGKELWRTSVTPGKYPRGYSMYAIPTPVTDGKRVYAWFGSGVFAAIDFDGKVVWRDEMDDSPPKNIDGLINSPILYKDTVIRLVNLEQSQNKGLLQALDTETGKVKWEQPLPKSGHADATPLLLPTKPEQLIVPSGSWLQSVKPEDGTLIWSVKRPMGNQSPLFANGLLVVDAGGASAMAIDPTGQGDVTKTNIKWKTDKTPASYAYASAGISGDYIYRATRQAITCWRLSTGEELFTEKVEDLNNLASPVTTADGLVWFCCSGKTYIIKPGPKLDVETTNELGGFHGNNGGSPAFSNGRIYVRDAEPAGKDGALLYCIGNK